jgi:hypothetical protein
MGRILGDAIATIVAAAGDNEDYGLPGVSSLHRLAQPRACTGNTQLVSTLPHVSELVSNSKWATRDWMYQED